MRAINQPMSLLVTKERIMSHWGDIFPPMQLGCYPKVQNYGISMVGNSPFVQEFLNKIAQVCWLVCYQNVRYYAARGMASLWQLGSYQKLHYVTFWAKPTRYLFRNSLTAALWLIVVLLSPPLQADHGPLTTAAGASVMSAEPLKPGGYIVSSSALLTNYERLTDSQIRDLTQRAAADIHVDALRSAMLASLGIDYGITAHWDVGLRLPWYRGDSLREGLIDSGGNYRLLDLGSVAGMADPSVRSRYLLWNSVQEFLNIQAGIKAPLGKTSRQSEAVPLSDLLPATRPGNNPIAPHVVTPSPNANPLNDRYYVEPALMPGSGAWDFSGGMAYTRYLAPRTALSVSGQYIRRGTFETYRLGDLAETGLSFSHRWGSRDETNITLFTEMVYQYRAAITIAGKALPNTGGHLLQAGWGILVGLPSGLGLMASSQLPAGQWLNEPQQRIAGRYLVAVSYAP